MSHKLTCIITGKSITVGNEYFDKKVKDFGTEEKFNSLYVSRQAKSLLKRGYKVKEIRELLKISGELQDISEKTIKEILSIKDEESNVYENSGIKRSDPDVIEYITALR
jgi:uncharacterized protein YfbU (UPF0304 family)